MSEKAVSDQHTREVWNGSGAELDGLRAPLSASGDPVYLNPGGITRLRKPRMTVRSLLIIVALAAFATHAGLTGWRALCYRKRAADHFWYLRSARSMLSDSWELREWHDQMRRKYERAMFRPWLPVEPDPPPPE
jgi:hypothetical protein